jgi:hypothetical protein
MTGDFPDPGEVPVLDWIDKALITVDPLYQRPLDAERAATIAKAFSWRSFGALVVVPAGDGYHVTDGQHRLEAAKLHPKVTHVPAVIVQVETIQSEAGMFVDINKNRKNVSALELFFAELAAETGNAAETLKAAQAAGIRIPKYPGNYRPNDTVAVGALQALVANYAEGRVQAILAAVAAPGFKPISVAQIKAVECLLTDPEFAPQIESGDLAALLKAVGTTLDGEARRFAATHCTPFWKALASTWFQKCKKRRAPAKASIPAQEAPNSTSTAVEPPIGGAQQRPAPLKPTGIPHQLAGLVRPEIAARAAEMVARNAPLRRVNVTASVLGDPEPGRSALDQRRSS